MPIYKNKTISIKAAEIKIGTNVSFGQNIDIDIRGKFIIGNRSHLGNNAHIRGNNISFGNDLYNSSGLKIGGGGYTNPAANFIIGDRCTIHNNYINLAESVIIGNDVGFSMDVTVLTHGYWLSVLDGYPAKFAGVKIADGVIIGYRSIIMMGISIAKNIVIGAGSVVTKNLIESNSIYAGNPAKFIKTVIPLSRLEKIKKITKIIDQYKKIIKHHKVDLSISFYYPNIIVNSCKFNVETLSFSGIEDSGTDHFRDYARKWGLRYYSNRSFKTNDKF